MPTGDTKNQKQFKKAQGKGLSGFLFVFNLSMVH